MYGPIVVVLSNVLLSPQCVDLLGGVDIDAMEVSFNDGLVAMLCGFMWDIRLEKISFFHG